MTLCGFYGFDGEYEFVGSDWDVLADFVVPFYFLRHLSSDTPAPTQGPSLVTAPWDYTKSASYQQSQAGLTASQARAQAAAARASAPRTAAIPVNLPSFSLPGTAAYTPPYTPAPAAEPVPTTVEGDAPMSNVVAQVEAVTKHHGLHSSIAPSGACSCPSCGTPLCIKLAPGPTAAPGAHVGEVCVIGALKAKAPAVKAASTGTCLCHCPACGVPICLSLETEPTTVSGYHIIGATKAPARVNPHKEVIARAGKAVAKASKAGASATNRAKLYDPSKHKPIVPLVAVKGDDILGGGRVVHVDESIEVFGRGGVIPIENTIDVFGVLLGAVTAKPLTPVQKAKVQKHADAVIRHAAAAKKAAAAGAKASAAAKVLEDHRQKKAPVIAKFINQRYGKAKGNEHVIGWDVVVFGLDAYGNPPGAPGYDPTTEDGTGFGTPGGGGGGYDPYGTGGGGMPSPSTYDINTDPDIVRPDPPVRGQPLTAAEAKIPMQNVPPNGVNYDGTYGLPQDSVGSWNAFYGGSDRSADGKWGIPSFLRGSPGAGVIHWMYADPAQTKDKNFHDAPATFQSTATDGAPICDSVSSNSLNKGWGPIVGNPKDPYLAGLQYAIADKVWFWQAEKAPAWATFQADAVLSDTNKKIAAANQAAVDADNARIAQEQAQMDEDRAKQDAANALAQSAADTQANIAAQAQAAQQAQADLQQQVSEQQQAAQQAAADIQAQQLAQQQDAQWASADLAAQSRQAQLDAQARQIQLEYIQQHPEVMAQPGDDGGGGIEDPSALPEGAFTDDGGGDYGDPFDAANADM